VTQDEELMTEVRLALAKMEEQLANILRQTTLTNGRVTALEIRADLQNEFRTQVRTIAKAAMILFGAMLGMVKVFELIQQAIRR
jgi:hypothetical protein